jgi:hypothetical protein
MKTIEVNGALRGDILIALAHTVAWGLSAETEDDLTIPNVLELFNKFAADSNPLLEGADYMDITLSDEEIEMIDLCACDTDQYGDQTPNSKRAFKRVLQAVNPQRLTDIIEEGLDPALAEAIVQDRELEHV